MGRELGLCHLPSRLLPRPDQQLRRPAQALNVTYNIADFVNKIAFVLACWSCPRLTPQLRRTCCCHEAVEASSTILPRCDFVFWQPSGSFLIMASGHIFRTPSPTAYFYTRERGGTGMLRSSGQLSPVDKCQSVKIVWVL